QSVKVMTSILGLELGSTLEQAHAKLDKLSDPRHPPKDEKEGSESKVLWHIANTDYSAIFIKSDAEKRSLISMVFCVPGERSRLKKSARPRTRPCRMQTRLLGTCCVQIAHFFA